MVSGSDTNTVIEKYSSQIFSEEDVVLLLEEYKVFAATNVKNRWVEFRNSSQLSSDYTVRQLSEKIRSLRKSFLKKKKNNNSSSSSRSPHAARVFELSQLIWGDQEEEDETTVTKRQRVEKNEEQELLLRTLHLYYRKLLLQQEECQIELDKFNNHIQSKEKKIENINDTHSKKEDLFVDKGFELKDEEDCEQERSKKLEDEDLPIACVKDKIENQPSDSKKKKKSERKRDPIKGKQGNVEPLPSSVAIEELALGDPNRKSVTSGMKVRIHFTAKLKDTGHIFDSTIGQKPSTFSLDDKNIIDGITIGLEGMRVGGRRRVIIPPSFGYGEEGFNGIVPPNSWLEYEIELINVRKVND